LVIGTGYFGWLIWSFVTWGKGQTPAQNLLRMISINEKTGLAAKRLQMFIRFILVFAAYWLGYFAIANIAFAINPNGILLIIGTLMLLAFHLVDISGILRRSDQKRLADVATGIAVKEKE
jgi:D-alanyl-lipoteichoic acid acyltransferase DltB (MBOAT superfamily)